MISMVQVIKFDGRKEEFDREKIIRTCLRVGVSRDRAQSIADKISQTVVDGMTTREIYQAVKKELATKEKKSAFVYGLRESVSSMDPVIFEIYVKKILEAHGYQCQYNQLIEGLCVEHQVDIIATREKKYLVECKRHHNPHRFSGLGVCLQVQARLDDIKDGFANKKNAVDFSQAWIITNTKFSDHAKKYADAKNIRLTGWRYPDEEGFDSLIDSKKLYPVTLLKTRRDVIEKLHRCNLITIQDLNEDSLSHACIEDSVARKLLDQKKFFS
jgi:hypothetical protein